MASGLGSVKVPSTIVPVLMPSIALNERTVPDTGRSVTVAVPESVTVAPLTSVTFTVVV